MKGYEIVNAYFVEYGQDIIYDTAYMIDAKAVNDAAEMIATPDEVAKTLEAWLVMSNMAYTITDVKAFRGELVKIIKRRIAELGESDNTDGAAEAARLKTVLELSI